MHVYGGLPAPLAVIAVLALAGVPGHLLRRRLCRVSPCCAAAACFCAAVLFAALWLLAELVRVTWFTGFPWGAGGYAHVDGPLAALAPQIGVHGIGFVAALLAFALSVARAARALRDRWRYWAALAGACGLLAACNMAAVPEQAPATQPRLSVALLQGNIPQDEKFEGRHRHPGGAGLVRPATAGQHRQPGGGARNRDTAAAAAIAGGLLRGAARALCAGASRRR